MANLLAPRDNRIMKTEDIVNPNIFDAGINFGQQTLNDYREVPLTIQWSGALTSTALARLTKVGRQVLLEIIPFSATTVANNVLNSNEFIPAGLKPLSNAQTVGSMSVAGNIVPVMITLTNVGALNIVLGLVSGSNVVFSNPFPNATGITMLNRISLNYTVG